MGFDVEDDQSSSCYAPGALIALHNLSSQLIIGPFKAVEMFVTHSVNRDISHLELSPKEWDVLEVFELVLEVCLALVYHPITNINCWLFR